MLIGHLPAGYFTTRYVLKKLKLPVTKLWLSLGLIASILPDFDIIYTVLVKDSMGSHRYYFTNFPFLYLTVFLLSVIVFYSVKKQWPASTKSSLCKSSLGGLKIAIFIIFTNILVHFLLDTMFVGIKWLWPFSDVLVGVYNVALTEGIIVENYFHHWYWYLEIALWIITVISVTISYKRGELK